MHRKLSCERQKAAKNQLGKDSSKTYLMFELEEGQQSTKARGIITLEGST
jgi:hypothetical protein